MAKVALITGTSSGIGLLAAVELARAGFRVVATMRNLERAERLRAAAAQAGVQLDLRRLDVCDPASAQRTVDSVLRDHGRIDVLVNNAGYALGGFAEDVLLPELREQFETNFFGQVTVTRAVLPAMRRQRSGHVIMIGSISGRAASPVTSSYAASKFALEGWSESLRLECAALGIKVVLIEPGSFATDIWDKNVRISAGAQSDSSPNRERARRFAEMVKTKLKKDDPIAVARLITRVAQHPDPRLRYIIGGRAHVQYWLRLLLPWKIYERMVVNATRIGEP